MLIFAFEERYINYRNLLAEVKAEEIRLPLGLDKHQRPLLGVAPLLVEDADELLLLLILGSSMESLHHICTRAANEPNLNIKIMTDPHENRNGKE